MTESLVYNTDKSSLLILTGLRCVEETWNVPLPDYLASSPSIVVFLSHISWEPVCVRIMIHFSLY